MHAAPIPAPQALLQALRLRLETLRVRNTLPFPARVRQHEVIGQLEGLRLLEPQFEDELFTLVRDSWEKAWQLRQLYRSDHLDEASAERLREQIEALHEQLRSLEASYRKQSLALLSSQQIEALGVLEAVLGLSPSAEDAACANLLKALASCEPIPGLAALAWGPLGSAFCGLGWGIATVYGEHIEGDDGSGALPFDGPN